MTHRFLCKLLQKKESIIIGVTQMAQWMQYFWKMSSISTPPPSNFRNVYDAEIVYVPAAASILSQKLLQLGSFESSTYKPPSGPTTTARSLLTTRLHKRSFFLLGLVHGSGDDNIDMKIAIAKTLKN